MSSSELFIDKGNLGVKKQQNDARIDWMMTVV